MLDTVVPEYLQDDDLGAQAPSGERALGLVRGYATRTTTRRWRQRPGRSSRGAGTGSPRCQSRPADRFRDGRGPPGWRLTAARAGQAHLVRSGTDA